MDSRSAAIAPPFGLGADGALDHPASLPSGARPPGQGRLFTITDLRVHHADRAVQHDRSGCSPCSDLGVHVRPIWVFTLDRNAH